MHVVQSAVLLLLLFLVAPFWNIQLKYKLFKWYHPIQCCKMKISKISDIYRKYQKYPAFSKISRYFPSLNHSQKNNVHFRQIHETTHSWQHCSNRQTHRQTDAATEILSTLQHSQPSSSSLDTHYQSQQHIKLTCHNFQLISRRNAASNWTKY